MHVFRDILERHRNVLQHVIFIRSSAVSSRTHLITVRVDLPVESLHSVKFLTKRDTLIEHVMSSFLILADRVDAGTERVGVARPIAVMSAGDLAQKTQMPHPFVG
jgi:hypothetical protein